MSVRMAASTPEVLALALEIMTARLRGEAVAVPPSARAGEFDLAAAYAVEAELERMRADSGHRSVGYKVGFANKAMWRVLGLETLVWAHMYDDTVVNAERLTAPLPLARTCSPKIEPEIVFTMKQSIGADTSDPAAVLAAVQSIALGFEIIDCPYPDWKFQPADFVATFGLHVALVVGEPREVRGDDIATLVEQLPRFKVRLLKDGHPVAEGSGKNVLRSPALCLGELASAMARRLTAKPLVAGDLVSSGTLTESQPIAAGETWTAVVEGLDLPEVTVRT